MLCTTLLLTALLTFDVAIADTVREIYGNSAKMNGQSVIIDKSFLKRLNERPTLDEWKKNRWELIYLINVGNTSARSIGIEVLAHANPDQAKHDDDDLVRPLARALSQAPQFWTLLGKKPAEIKSKVIRYFDVIPEDYTGFDKADYEWRKQQLFSERTK